jgi:hypothetical protein
MKSIMIIKTNIIPLSGNYTIYERDFWDEPRNNVRALIQSECVYMNARITLLNVAEITQTISFLFDNEKWW